MKGRNVQLPAVHVNTQRGAVFHDIAVDLPAVLFLTQKVQAELWC